MDNKIQVWPHAASVADGEITLAATIEQPGKKAVTLWYRVAERYRDALTSSADPFVIALVFIAMRTARPLLVHGTVSPSLLRNLEEYQALWSCWMPKRYRPITITADHEQEQPPAAQPLRAAVAFSGGVDSCFTLWRHKTAACGRLSREVGAAVMVHGFDIALHEKEMFAKAVERSAQLLEGLDVTLIPMATNYRELGDYWGDTHGSAVASCLMLLQKRYAQGLIGSTWTYAYAEPWGSSPVGDWMLSNATFQTIHDGAAFSRADKISALAQWPAALRYLRVCWEGADKDKNCGRCEKCIRTILNFRVLGLGLPPCFESDVSDRHIAELAGLEPTAINELENVLTLARAKAIRAPWVTALEKCIKRNRRALYGWSCKRVCNGIQRRINSSVNAAITLRRRGVPL